MKRQLAAAAAVIAVVTLAGCAGESLGAGRLAESKAPAQLLRIEAASRLPGYMVESTAEGKDGSHACDAGDLEGKKRFWQSSVEVHLRDNESVRPVAMIEELVAGFEEQDWQAAPGDSSLITVLTKSSLDTTISLTRTPMETGGTITIAVDGPCVMTDGAQSPAVMKLDGRA